MQQLFPIVCELFAGGNRRWQLYVAAQTLIMQVTSFPAAVAGLAKFLEKRQTVMISNVGPVAERGRAIAGQG